MVIVLGSSAAHARVPHSVTSSPPPAPQTEFEPGAGTYVAGSFVCASLVGIQRTVPVEETADKVLRVLVE